MVLRIATPQDMEREQCKLQKKALQEAAYQQSKRTNVPRTTMFRLVRPRLQKSKPSFDCLPHEILGVIICLSISCHDILPPAVQLRQLMLTCKLWYRRVVEHCHDAWSQVALLKWPLLPTAVSNWVEFVRDRCFAQHLRKRVFGLKKLPTLVFGCEPHCPPIQFLKEVEDKKCRTCARNRVWRVSSLVDAAQALKAGFRLIFDPDACTLPENATFEIRIVRCM
eukprot:TRINITY_DN8648_c0_g3_i1.p1 TRINITY_DN8648_c0_g3~~TRINITY_DN8648_c0_g3_i1.p1  ORF type:complete len:223 (-),score=32.14 TRINITY_DN8648_c0_g3_i1:21-689(-)